jgi:uncharacterized protein (DUF1499 family)
MIFMRPMNASTHARLAASGHMRKALSLLPRLAIGSAALALVCLAGAPVSWRTGLLPLKASFMLLSGAGLLGILAGILAALALLFAWRSLGRPRIALLFGVVVLGIVFIGVGWHLRHSHAPPINDITTDTENPPAIVAALAARQAEGSVSEVYGGPAVAKMQILAYPDIEPAILTMPISQAFDLALNTASSMPGWSVIASDSHSGTIEATQASFWYGFVDDIVIRVSVDGNGSRIDIRSHSRHGRGDLGVNAARIRKYLAALKAAAH